MPLRHRVTLARGRPLRSRFRCFSARTPQLRFSLLLPLCAVAAASCSKPAPAHNSAVMLVETQRVESVGTSTLSDSAPEYIAAVRANGETDLSFKVGGIVELIGPEPHHDWEEGSTVKNGAVLARLEQADFKNALASARAHAQLAENNNERLSKLLAGNVVSKQEADKTRADSETASAQLHEAEQALRDSELRASGDGVILARYVNSGETVAPGKPVLRFGDVRTMSVEMGVPDRMIGQFKVGSEINVEISALPGHGPFRGRVSEVGIAASKDGRLYRVVIKVPNPDGVIRSGMTASVRASESVQTAAGQVQVPLSALVAAPGKNDDSNKPPTQLGVFVVKDGKASLRMVTTGDIIASSVIVNDGLRPGEEVVTRGASQLHDGAAVAVP